MNPTAITLIVIGVIVVVAAVAWILYRLGFKAKEITVKAGPVEAKMEREADTPDKPTLPKPRTEATQEAVQGGRIKDSNIRAPADSGAKLKQKAAGEGSSISDSDIQLE